MWGDEMIRKGKLYSKTDPNDRNSGRFYFTYVYSPTFRLSEHSPVAAINHRGLNICLSGQTTGERPKCLPDWTAAQVFFVMSPRGNVNTRVFSRGTASWGSAGLWWRYQFTPCLLACFQMTPATPATLTDLGVIRGEHACMCHRVKVNIKHFP